MGAGFSVARAVRLARERAGLSARELSRKGGLSPSYVTKVESGEIEPSLWAFAKIASAVGMTRAEIYYCVLNESLREGRGEAPQHAPEYCSKDIGVVDVA